MDPVPEDTELEDPELAPKFPPDDPSFSLEIGDPKLPPDPVPNDPKLGEPGELWPPPDPVVVSPGLSLNPDDP